MTKFAKGLYKIKNKEKYIGTHTPVFRSSWECNFMIFLDNHTSIINWGSECVRIPYKDPITGKTKNYIPDFFIVYIDVNGKKCAEIVEIKPMNQSKMGKSAKNNALALRNHHKWSAALAYASRNGCSFRLITENQLFGNK